VVGAFPPRRPEAPAEWVQPPHALAELPMLIAMARIAVPARMVFFTGRLRFASRPAFGLAAIWGFTGMSQIATALSIRNVADCDGA
jgi:hypothetical protein